MHVSLEDFEMPEGGRVSAIANTFRLLSDPTRLMIVFALAQGETNPSCLAELAGLPLPAVSQHLAKLRLAGVCQARRDGQRVWYELIDPTVRALIAHVADDATATEARGGSGR